MNCELNPNKQNLPKYSCGRVTSMVMKAAVAIENKWAARRDDPEPGWYMPTGEGAAIANGSEYTAHLSSKELDESLDTTFREKLPLVMYWAEKDPSKFPLGPDELAEASEHVMQTMPPRA